MTTRFAARDGLRIAYDVEGEGPAVVLIHGGAGDRTMWRRAGYLERLPDRRVVSVDLHGYGQSETPTGPGHYTLPGFISDVLAVLDAERIEEAVVWGYSMGGHVAAGLGLRHPERVRALIASGYLADFGPDEECRKFAQDLRGRGMGWLTSSLDQEEPGVQPTWLRELFLATPVEPFARAVEAFGDGGEVRTRIGGLEAATLFVVGEREDPKRDTDVLARRMPRARVLRLAGLGHVGAFLATGHVCDAVRGFIQSTHAPQR